MIVHMVDVAQLVDAASLISQNTTPAQTPHAIGSRLMKRVLFVLAIVFTVGQNFASAQPVISSTGTHGLPPGQTTEITLTGDKLDAPMQIWTSFPAQVELIAEGSTNKAYKCKLTLDNNVPVGIGGIVVGNASGVSDPVLIMIDDLPTIADNGTNHSPAQAQVVTLPCAVDGTADGPSADFYRFTAVAGQQISVEAVAARVATTADPVLTLFNAAGNEILLVDDDAGLGADCRFAHTIVADGDYILKLHDNKFAGGGRYRLRIGDFPIVNVPFPLGARFGSTARVQFAGPKADGAQSVILNIPASSAAGRIGVSAKLPEGKSSAMTSLVLSDLPSFVESEPNNVSEEASKITLPCSVSGRLANEKDQDYYEFAAAKGQQFTFRAISRSLGSPSVITMRLLKIDEAQLSESPVGESGEDILVYTFPEDGVYRLLVADLLHRGGPDHAYYIGIEEGGTFSLSIKNDKTASDRFLLAPQRGALTFEVQCARNGFDGPITLSIEGGDGWRLYNNVVAAKAAAAKMIAIVPTDFNPGETRVVRIVGTANVAGRSVTSAISTAAYLRTKRPQLPYPAAWNDGLFGIATAAASDPLFDVKLEAPTVEFSRESGQALAKMTLERKNGDFKAALVVIHDPLPSGFGVEVKPEGDVYNVTVNGPKDAAGGQRMIRLLCFGELNGRVEFIQRELSINVAPAGAE